MADNFLERRERELKEGGKTLLRRSSPSLESLLLHNRSHRCYDPGYKVHRLQLEAIVRVNTMTASGRNAQTLRFKLVDSESPAFEALRAIKVGGSLPGGGVEVGAGGFIVVCPTVDENPIVDIDLGISLQSMGLKATELGLNALIIRSFNAVEVRDLLALPSTPLAILAIGKGTDKIKLVEVREGESLKYYRKDGIHFVPKLSMEDLML